MNIFDIHTSILSDYKSFIKSFINVKDDRIRKKVEEELESGKLWPDPILHFNPSYAYGDEVKSLIDEKILDPAFEKLLTYPLYKHQTDAIRLGCAKRGFVVTSGTGSGKSLTYLVPITNHILKHNIPLGQIKAIIVYPMNALINSQTNEIEEKYSRQFKEAFGSEIPIGYKQYTGQEDEDERNAIRENPPQVLLTNYMMLELLMTRVRGDEKIRTSIFENLEFLVFDELHTYRGRQGSDVGMLIRRIKAQCKHEIVCIGTSATMASAERTGDQKQIVADFASRFFAADFSTDQIVTEQLAMTLGANLPRDLGAIEASLSKEISPEESEDYLLGHDLTGWFEREIVLDTTQGQISRGKPRTLAEIASHLSNQTGVDKDTCQKRIVELLVLAERVNEAAQPSDQKRSYFAYKIHQFINQTGSVYATLQSLENREITLIPKTKSLASEGMHPFYQIVFSRITGHELLCVTQDRNKLELLPQEFSAMDEDDDEEFHDGYVFFDYPGEEPVWNPERDLEQLPASWWTRDKSGALKIQRKYLDRVPVPIFVSEDGSYRNEPTEGYRSAWFLSRASRVDPTSGTVYDHKTKHRTIYSSLGNEGRSTATNVLGYSIIRRFAEAGFSSAKQKLLSFTDNRQDTALQSGHFNDFMKAGQLRSAIYHALNETKVLTYSNVVSEVRSRLKLDQDELFQKTAAPGTYQDRENEKAITALLYYRILADLKRGWRVVLPNLEQCGLLRIDYADLELESAKSYWDDLEITKRLSQQERYDFFYQILDYFRKSNAAYFSVYQSTEIEKNTQIFKGILKKSWLYDSEDSIEEPYYLRVQHPQRKARNVHHASVGYLGSVGRYIRRTCSEKGLQLDNPTYDKAVGELLDALDRVGYLIKDLRLLDVSLYRLNGVYVQWIRGEGESIIEDKIKNPSYKTNPRQVNEFFRAFYKTDFSKLKRISSGEHSGQLKTEQRIAFEEAFREGKLSMLCCSPTMELGIDISDLTAVHMRNIPPNPANYAQRSGRAGRGGQGALIFTYCSTFSAHDQHYFENKTDMVSGVVVAPRLDYSNTDLLKGHLHALYLTEVGLENLNRSLADLVVEDPPELKLVLKSEVLDKLKLSENQTTRILQLFRKVCEYLPKSEKLPDMAFIGRALSQAPEAFNSCLDRWRNLYRQAARQLQEASIIINDVTIPTHDPRKTRAKTDQTLAQRQIDLLRSENLKQGFGDRSEFYPFRYLAAEGFLPGYNFTRLPIRLFVPHEEGHHIARARFSAIREFGPLSSIYYMGGRYHVQQMPATDITNKLSNAKVELATGYILVHDEYDRDTSPFSGRELSNDTNRLLIHKLIELSDSRSEELGRITCEEEERISRGFEIKTYFNMRGNLDKVQKLVAKYDGQPMLNIHYLPAANLYKVNFKWRSSDREGFSLNTQSAYWKRPKPDAPDEEKQQTVDVKLFTHDTADAVYIEPVENLNLPREGVVTLLYALKRGIEAQFQVESNEIGAEVMGLKENPNIMIYESSQGSLGILHQLVEQKDFFRMVARSAYEICHFTMPEEEQKRFGVASYHDLLSYYNQYYHKDIDRTLIKEALENLMQADYEIVSNRFASYDDHYERIVSQIDPSSSTEVKFIDFLFRNGLRLPDRAQVDMRNPCNTIPDFVYDGEVRVCVFCDGSHHDDEYRKRFDDGKRSCLRNLGYEVLVWHYATPLSEFVSQRSDIFKKVR